MIVAVRAIFITFLIVIHVFPEGLLTLLAHKCHLSSLPQTMVLCLCVAFCTIEPLLAAGCSDGYLCIQYMFAVARQIRRRLQYSARSRNCGERVNDGRPWSEQ